jgi:NAD(P)-dependent dehydrogenase (short-subunit alcohol dehydrogenase family)
VDINGSTILITGGCSGLGAACVKYFTEKNTKIIILDKTANPNSKNNNIIYFQCDVANSQQVDEIFGRLNADSLIPRIVINCAGIAPAKRIVGKSGPMALEDFTNCININLNGTFNILRNAAYLMSKLSTLNNDGERGVIINTASIAAYEGQLGQAAYSASKAGIIGMTLPAARELANYGIRVNTIAPGVFSTALLHGMSQEVQDSLVNSIPFPKRLGKPEEYASLVAEIITNPAFNGATIRLDNAMRLN